MLWLGHDVCRRLLASSSQLMAGQQRQVSLDGQTSIHSTAQSDSPCHAATIPADSSHDSTHDSGHSTTPRMLMPIVHDSARFWAFSHYEEGRSPGSGYIHTTETRLRASSWWPHAQNPSYDTRIPRITGRDMPRTDRAVVPHDANMPRTDRAAFSMVVLHDADMPRTGKNRLLHRVDMPRK